MADQKFESRMTTAAVAVDKRRALSSITPEQRRVCFRMMRNGSFTHEHAVAVLILLAALTPEKISIATGFAVQRVRDLWRSACARDESASRHLRMLKSARAAGRYEKPAIAPVRPKAKTHRKSFMRYAPNSKDQTHAKKEFENG